MNNNIDVDQALLDENSDSDDFYEDYFEKNNIQPTPGEELGYYVPGYEGDPNDATRQDCNDYLNRTADEDFDANHFGLSLEKKDKTTPSHKRSLKMLTTKPLLNETPIYQNNNKHLIYNVPISYSFQK